MAFVAFTYKPPLSKVHESIEASYQNVAHIDAEVFSKLDKRQLIIFDVRELAEFRVSHLQGAIQIDPDISVQEFEINYADLLADKTLIFYCSVGKRSSALASKLQQIIIDSQAVSAYNLIGGIFQWRNDARQLVESELRTTTKIHPYNKYWSRYITNKHAISYIPTVNNGDHQY